MEKLTQNMKERAKKLLESGYKRAAESFSSMTNQKVEITKVEMMFSDVKGMIDKLGNQHDVTILLTEIIGDAKGKSYLMLNKYDTEKVVELMLTRLKNFENNDYYQDIILKELDNVMAAAVITQLSNSLDLKVYGDVPTIFRPKEKIQDWFKYELEKSTKMTAVMSTVSFAFQNDIKLQPLFIWILDNTFYENLKLNSQQHENIKLTP